MKNEPSDHTRTVLSSRQLAYSLRKIVAALGEAGFAHDQIEIVSNEEASRLGERASGTFFEPAA
ncbi:MAG: hypothetical protein ACJ789_02105 [Thermomicrobiales bacterium]